MELKVIVLSCIIITVTVATEKEVTKETQYADEGDDLSIQNIAKISKQAETNKKFENIFARMELLEAREKAREQKYMNEIQILKHQLSIQTRRTASLERLVKSLHNKKVDHDNKRMEKQDESTNNVKRRIMSPKVQSRDVKRSQRIRRAENENPVAFFATLDQHLTHVGIHQPIAFDNVTTNIGNAYNSHFGSFIAPVPGTYVFSATLFSHYHADYHVQFVKNGQSLTNIYMRGSESGYGTMSQTIVLQLQKGDDVSIQNNEVDSAIFGANYCTFSGFLLQEEFSSAAVVGK
ncbi:uncharacterized protein LOC123561523 [Mercenaria mercenaria]|uniref:uncharacterized protein LOC123561523 n=1 Tax=Mercenaria mercenaria TaxID=6596 RepID=UPI001E1DD07E|nr:uncharacterized protein LOC123561523 [Mercenaria mercenaria]